MPLGKNQTLPQFWSDKSSHKQTNWFKSTQIEHDCLVKNSKAKIKKIIDWENVHTKYESQGQIADIIKLLIQIYSKSIMFPVDC